MGIRIGITDGDREFFDRFRTAFKEQFEEEFEVYLFPDLSKAVRAVEQFRLKAVLIETPEHGTVKVPAGGLPESAYYARLCDRKQEEKEWQNRQEILTEEPLDSIPLLCRFRSAEEWRELLLREIASLPENSHATPRETDSDDDRENIPAARVVLFTSAAGGTGVSTAARSFAECCLRHSRNVLYLDLQTFPDRHGTPGDDLYTLEDILLAVRGVRYSPDALLERALRTSDSGLLTLRPPANPAALFDMTGEEIVTIVDLVKELGYFSTIILDLDFDSSERAVLPFLTAERVVLVSSGTQIANRKTEQLIHLLPTLCTEDPMTLYEKTCLLYNRFRKGRSEVLKTELLYKLGGVGELDVTDPEDLAEEISAAPAMERLYEFLTL